MNSDTINNKKMFSSSSPSNQSPRSKPKPIPNIDFDLPSWSFENANHAISINDPSLKRTIISYLATQDSLISSPLNFFANTSKQTNTTKIPNDYNLDLESMNYLSEKCNVNIDQVVRVCHQTNRRKLLNLYENLSIHEDNNSILLLANHNKNSYSSITNPKNLIYSSEILNEKRQFIKLIALLFENKTQLFSPDLKYYESILISSESILKFLIDEIETIYQLIISDSSMVQYLLVSQSQNEDNSSNEEYFTFIRTLTSIFKKESSAYLSDVFSLIIQISIPIDSSVQSSKRWFSLMKSTWFLSDLWSSSNFNSENFCVYKSGKSQMIIISLLLLGLIVDDNRFDENAPQFKDKDTFLLIHSLMTKNPKFQQDRQHDEFLFDNSLLMYSWCVILQIKYFLFQQEQEEQGEFLKELQLSSVDEFQLKYLQPAILSCSLSLIPDSSTIFTQFIELYQCLKFNEIYIIMIISIFKILSPFISISSSSTSASFSFVQFIQCLISRFSNKENFLQDILMNNDDVGEDGDSAFSSTYLEAIRLNQLKSPSDTNSLISLLNLLSIDAQFADITLTNSQTYLHFFKSGDFDYEYVTITTSTTPTSSSNSTPDLGIANNGNAEGNQAEKGTSAAADSATSVTAAGMDTVILKHPINIRPPFQDIFSNNYFQIPQGTQGKLILHNRNHIRNNNDESIKNQQQGNDNPADESTNGNKITGAISSVNASTDSPMNAIIFDFKYNGWSMLGKIFENLIYSLTMMANNNENALDIADNEASNTTIDSKNREAAELLLSILKILISVFSTASPSQYLEIIRQIEQPLTQSLDFFDLIFKLLTCFLKFKAIDHLALINKLFITMMKRDVVFKEYSSSSFSFVNIVWAIIIKANYFNNGIIKYGNFGSNLLLDLVLVKEKSQGKFQFTSSLIKLSNYLIDDTLTVNIINNNDNDSFKAKGNELISNNGNFEYNMISLKVKQDTVARIVSIYISFFENFMNWNFKNQEERFHLGDQILIIFSKIISVTYSVQQQSNDSNKQNPLKISADKIVNSFLHNNELGTLTTKPIISIIDNLTNITDFHICTCVSDIVSINYNIFVHTLFDFTKLLISLRPQMIPNDKNVKHRTFLETTLISKLKQILQIYMKFPDLKINVISLITALISNDNDQHQKEDKQKASSLLAQLGNNYSMVLLNCLIIDLEGPLIPFSLKTALYSFFSNIMRTNQEGLSILLLAGNNSLDKKSFAAIQQKTTNKNSENKSILKILKENVINLKNYPDSVAIYLLDAISYTLNSWSITQRLSDNDEKFINSLATYFIENFNYLESENDEDKDAEMEGVNGNGEFDDLSTIVNKSIKKCYKVELLASIERILALYLYNNPDEKTIKPILDLIQDEKFIKQYASRMFQVKDYNAELHLKTYKNFENELNGYKLTQYLMNSNSFNRKQYGVGCVYNLPLIDKQFGDNLRWKDSIRRSVILSDLNIQYASAQTSLIKSSGALVTSYVKCKSYDSNLDLSELATILLNINNNEGLTSSSSRFSSSASSSSFRQNYLERIELAFFLVYNLFQHTEKTSSKSKINNIINDERIFRLFEAIANSLLSDEVNFLVSLANQDFHIYRSLLRILSITLRLCFNKAHLLEKSPSLLIDLFAKVIANGSTVVISCIQSRNSNNNNSNSDTSTTSVLNSIEDLLLLISIFKSFVTINFSVDITATFASLLDINGTIKYIMELYTYSNSMLIEGQPVFADLALIYISEMISVNIVAEKLLSYGLFSILNNTAVSIIIQKGNIRVNTYPRYHHIWANGLLNIVLMLLSKFGPRVIPETCTFLKNFEKQIAFTLQGWTTKSMVINHSVIDETNKLILLHKALSSLSYKEYIGINSYSADNEEILFFPGLETMKQRNIFIRSLNYLLSHPKYFQSRIISDVNDFGFDNDKDLENYPPSRAKLVNKLTEDVKSMIEVLEDDKSMT